MKVLGKRTRALLIGLVVALAVLGATEIGLRTWVEHTPERLVSPLAFQRNSEPIASPGPTADSILFGGPNIVTSAKPVGLRIFFFGGSATEGYHMTPFSCFVGWTQRILWQLMPETSVELINLGAGGEASRQVADLVEATASSQSADLFVVYSGNHEYYELRALKAALPGFDARTELARRRLSGSHLYRHLRRWVLPATTALSPGTVLTPVDSIQTEIDASERELGVLLYGEHMERIIDAAARGGVPLLLSTVADQARSFAFHGDPPPLSPGVEPLVEALEQVGRRRDVDAASPTLAALRPKLKTQADYYAVARLLDRDQRWDSAREHYAQAEYLDPRPRRSSAPMRQTLRRVAETRDVPLCDAAALLSAQSPGGITGEDVFFDPCHPNPLGHRRLAEIFVRCLVNEGLIPGLEVTPERLEQVLAALPLEGEDPYRLDHFTERRAQLHDNRAMSQAEVEQTIRSFDDGTPAGAALAGHHATLFKLHRGALAWYDLALSRGGERPALQVSRGLTLKRLHDLEGARMALDEAVAGLPGDVEVAATRRVLGGEAHP